MWLKNSVVFKYFVTYTTHVIPGVMITTTTKDDDDDDMDDE